MGVCPGRPRPTHGREWNAAFGGGDQRAQRRRCVGRAAANTAAGRQMLFESEGDGRGVCSCIGKEGTEQVPRSDDEVSIGILPTERRGFRAGDFEDISIRGLCGDAVADIGEDRNRFQRVIAVGALSGHMQSEINLRRRVDAQLFFHRVWQARLCLAVISGLGRGGRLAF